MARHLNAFNDVLRDRRDDVYDPMLRYMFASLTRTTANAVVGGIIAIQYKDGFRPTSQHASVIASALGPGVSA